MRAKQKHELRKVLAMTLNRGPFEEIITGEKKTEYRKDREGLVGFADS